MASRSASNARGSPGKLASPSRRLLLDLGTSLPYSLKEANLHIGILQGSNYVEEAETSQCRSFRRRHEKSPAIYIRVDAKWDPNRVRQSKSGRESNWSGESSLFDCCSIDDIVSLSY